MVCLDTAENCIIENIVAKINSTKNQIYLKIYIKKCKTYELSETSDTNSY